MANLKLRKLANFKILAAVFLSAALAPAMCAHRLMKDEEQSAGNMFQRREAFHACGQHRLCFPARRDRRISTL